MAPRQEFGVEDPEAQTSRGVQLPPIPLVKISKWMSWIGAAACLAAFGVDLSSTYTVASSRGRPHNNIIDPVNLGFAKFVYGIVASIVMFIAAFRVTCMYPTDSSHKNSIVHLVTGSVYIVLSVLTFVALGENGEDGIIGIKDPKLSSRLVIVPYVGGGFHITPRYRNSVSDRRDALSLWAAGGALNGLIGLLFVIPSFLLLLNNTRLGTYVNDGLNIGGPQRRRRYW